MAIQIGYKKQPTFMEQPTSNQASYMYKGILQIFSPREKR